MFWMRRYKDCAAASVVIDDNGILSSLFSIIEDSCYCPTTIHRRTIVVINWNITSHSKNFTTCICHFVGCFPNLVEHVTISSTYPHTCLVWVNWSSISVVSNGIYLFACVRINNTTFNKGTNCLDINIILLSIERAAAWH